jgi:hypothetical protein
MWENIKLGAKNRWLDTPVRSQDMTPQRTRNLEMREQKKARQTEDHALWSRNTDIRKMTLPQIESAGYGTASQCPLSAETNDDFNVTMQTD